MGAASLVIPHEGALPLCVRLVWLALKLSWQCGTWVERDRGRTQNQLVDWDVASGLESSPGTGGSVCPQLSVMTTG